MPKLIEKDFPFAELSRIAEREFWRKEIYRPVYYLHKWWAKRLGSVFRGILLGACLEDNQNFWERFYQKNSFGNITVFDPFMGSGVTLGEAIKLGCRVIGRDINPVSFLACKASLSRYNLNEIFATYQNIERQLAPRLLSYFSTQTQTGEEAIVLYYFLVKIVSCPNCENVIELFKTRIFSKNAMPRKDPSARSLCPSCGAINETIFNSEKVKCQECSFSYNPQEGTVRGPKVTCGSCGKSFLLVDRMKNLEGPLGFKRYAKMILSNGGKKAYCQMNEFDRELEQKVASEYVEIAKNFPSVSIQPGYNTNQILKHNYKNWHQLFSDRQLICISHLLDSINQIKSCEIKLLFACLFSGVLEFNNLFASFKGEGTGAVRHMFSHHVFKPELMPLEANIWGTPKSSGSFSTLFQSRVIKAIDYKSNPSEIRLISDKSTKIKGINQPLSVKIVEDLASFSESHNTTYLSQGDSSCTEIPDNSVDLVVTDPPFFDNVHYSQLADFFYYWLNQILEFSESKTTRSITEVQDTDSDLFTKKLTSVFAECNRILKNNGLFIFTYHHSRHEGWTSIHRAIRHSALICQQSYPIKGEMSVSMPLQQANSPIHLDLILVCKKDVKPFNDFGIDDPIKAAISEAKNSISALKSRNIKVSLGDAKVVLMGRFLCEAHKMRSLETEEQFLKTIEVNIDKYVSEALKAEGEVIYEVRTVEQLTLFEKLEKYLTNKTLNRDG